MRSSNRVAILTILAMLLPLPATASWCAAQTAQTAQTAQHVGQYNLPGTAPYLVAHYMMWFSTPWSVTNQSSLDRTSMKWSHWTWNGGGPHHDPENKLPNGRRDIASILYPLIGPYDSGSRNVLRYDLETMKACGVSAVSAIWYGPGSNTDSRFPALLDEAQKLHMRAYICYEQDINFPGYRHPVDREQFVINSTGDLSYIATRYGKHPAYLRRNNLPIIQMFNSYGTDPTVGNKSLTPNEWRTVFSKLPSRIEFMRQNLDPACHPPIPAAYVWWVWGDWPEQFTEQAAALRDHGRLDFFMSMVCPGFNDTGVWGWGAGPRLSDGYGIKILNQTTQLALRNDPELVEMVTWNDFNEGTCFEPTVQHGSEYLQALAKWWHKNTGQQIHPDQIPVAFERYKQECSAQERAEIP
jgi:hypothetical protein